MGLKVLMMKMMRIKRQDFALISSLLLILLQPCIGHLKQDKILDKPSSQDVEHGFGAAKHFMPLPNTVVGSHCTWQLRLNTVPARIPGRLQMYLVVYRIQGHSKLKYFSLCLWYTMARNKKIN